MINKVVCVLLAFSIVAASNYGYNGSTTAAVTIAGAIVKAKHIDKEKKYPRKNCPVCKGTGKYLSGDGIKMVDCGYCEPEIKDSEIKETPQPENTQIQNNHKMRIYRK
jgi:hypothetical protein